jgi:hypothetical protein
MTVDKMNLSFSSGSIVSGNFDFMGKDSVRAGTTQLVGAPTTSATYDVMNAVSGVGNILENGAALANTFIKTASVALSNKLRGQTGIGTLGNVGIGVGALELKGAIEVYLADGTLYDKFVANTASSLSLRCLDASSNGYIFTWPKIKYSDAKVNAGGKDQDAMVSMPWEAIMDATTGVTMIVDRIGA